MIRGILGIFTGLLLWGFLWWSLNALLPLVFPKMFNHEGVSANVIINVLIVLLSFDFSFCSGYINAIIARVHEIRYGVIQSLLQLSVGFYLQRLHWDLLPLWFHVSFLILIVPGVITGVIYKRVND